MLTVIRRFISQLNQQGICYCHWKSNLALLEALRGETDIDLLVHRKDATRFREILCGLGFQPALTKGVEAFPAVEHYYQLDEESGILVHVHSYYRVITGESLTKNYHFPLEGLLLGHTRVMDDVPVPVKSAELLVFTLRIMLKHTSIFELFLLSRYWKQVRNEIKWLMEDEPVDETLAFLKEWLPPVDKSFFAECIEAIRKPAPTIQRIRLGYQLRSFIQPYGRHSMLYAWFGEVKKFSIMLYRRLTGSKLRMVPQSGGAIIAFVGSEATGKSTLLSEMNKWLGEHFEVDQIHVGKPKSTLITALPNLLLPALRTLIPTQRSTHIESDLVASDESEKPTKKAPMLFAIRSALLAYDRHALLTRAYSQAANGVIMFCDRYPSTQSGALDSPQLGHLPIPDGQFSLRRFLTALEARLYRDIPEPDLVIYLTAPLDVTLARNAARGKKEPEDYVRRRHARASNLDFGKAVVHRVNTDQPFEATLQEIKQVVWNAL